MHIKSNITQTGKIKNFSIRRFSVLVFVMLLLSSNFLFSQVIRNEGAAITVKSGTVIGSRDAINNAGGILSNDGDINLGGDYTSVATTSGNGFFRIGGNWTNTGGIFIPGLSTVVFNGSTGQLITRLGGETFFNLSIANTGLAPVNLVRISNNVNVTGTLSMSTGNVDADAFILYLSNQAAASLNYTSTTGSRIFGKFERGIGQTATYLFPLGTLSYYNPANLIMNSVSSTGSVLSQFLTSPGPGNAGLPIPDPPVEVATAFPDGYWRFTSSSFSTGDFNVNLDGAGFADTIRDVTRVIRRDVGGNWSVDGTHEDATGTVVRRNNLSGDISVTGTDFALGRTRPLITSHPVSLTVCENTNPTFSVTATGAEPLTYRWYHDGVIITNSPHYTGNRTSTLTINGAVLSDAGIYYCIVSDRYRDTTQSHSATLVVMKIPVATISPADQPHECSDIPIQGLVLDMTYHDTPAGTFEWTRDNPTGITSAIPSDSTAYNLGDIIAGSFSNDSDDPRTITFTVTPVGPDPTRCVGLPVTAYITVNPRPRVIVADTISQICNGNSTQIVLTSPTHMTQGIIQYDYDITTTATAPDLVGSTISVNDLSRDYTIVLPYQNNTDTMQSVFYHITPKNVISGCNNGTIVVPEVKVHPKPLQDMYVSVPFTCEGGTAGVLTSVLSKVSKPSQIQWIRPWRPDTVYNEYGYYNNLPIHFSGSYRVTVTDSLGCYNTSPVLDVFGATFNSTLYVKPTDTGYGTSCPDTADGEIWVWEETSSTAVAPFAFWLVRNGQDTVAHDTLYAKGYAYHKEIKDLSAGHYMLLIKDNNGCINIYSPESDIVEPDTMAVLFDKKEYIPGNYNVSCLNYTDGKVWIDSIAGGNGDYTYKWSTLNGMITGIDTMSVLDSISAGTYYLVTTDRHFCTKLDSVTLIQPEGIYVANSTLSLSPDSSFNIACTGDNSGSISLDVAGGSGEYLYSWTGPGSFSATTSEIHNLIPGIYTATIRDQANTNCFLAPLPSFEISEPDTLGIGAVLSSSAYGPYNINCHGAATGSIDITVTGGSIGNYQYEWSTIDGSGIVAGAEDQWTLTAGTYHLLVTDKNGCSKSADFTLIDPPELGTSLIPKHITCFPAGFNNGSVDLTVSGGVGPYLYGWSNGATSEDIFDLTEGKYTVTVTDANGCRLTDSTVVNLPPPLQYTKVLSNYNGFNISCNGLADGSVDITPSSGLPPYIFNWERTGEGTIGTSEDISGLTAGQYRLTITDANQCTTTEDIEMTEQDKFSMIIDRSSSIAGGYQINCAGASTGTIDVTPVNPAGSVSYLWSDGETTQSRTKMKEGTYGIIITDANGCVADSSVTLTAPPPIELNMVISQPWCPDKPDGEINLTPTGGVPGADYTYKWSDNSTGRNLTNIPSGLYIVTVTDLNGCSERDSVFVEPQRPTCLIIPNAISPNGDARNDEWNIGLTELYPQMEIKIFNRWGEIIWKSEKGYPHPWDGRSNGILLPVDSYHYIIDLHNGSKPILGNVTIVR